MYRQFSPAPCSPPLGGSDGCSAVRFTPAVKYGGRENWPSGRATRCIRGHPCRAHHKLKWARKLGRCTRASVFAFSTLREQQNNNRGKVPLPADAPPPTQTPTGQPCLTGVGNNPLTIPEHSRRAVSRMPKARRSRLSLTRCADWAALPLHMSVTSAFKEQQSNNRAKPCRFPKLQWVSPSLQGLATF